MTPGSSVTFGGLQIDTDAHVLDTNDQPISGHSMPRAKSPSPACLTRNIRAAAWRSVLPCTGRVAAANAVAGK
ncbi:MAG: hypothetical protein ACLUI3_14715 [Christensenellales bacterium]